MFTGYSGRSALDWVEADQSQIFDQGVQISIEQVHTILLSYLF